LATHDENGVTIISPEREVTVGSIVK